ncbi:MAG: cyclopropane-fatty-acyl-phospholipid synthase family protein [Candidatus Neomarinimicrobiota bacterium]
MISKLIELAEKGIIPDYFIRQGIVRNCENRLNNENVSNTEKVSTKKQSWIQQMKESPIALVPEKANEQHYEVPPAFFENVLGKHLKYSSGYWPDGVNSLDDSEESMLELSFERAQLADGDSILELGCGWGSLTCYMASKLPNSKITAVSNSKDQKEHILNRCKNQGLDNIEVITADMNDFGTENKYDRVVSIEMFEHMRNYKKLLSKISSWLHDDGKLFIHIFTHQSVVYPFENQGEADWMAREFFSGGMMPSHDLLLHFQDDLIIDDVWSMSGTHYEKTSLAWVNKMDANKDSIMKIFSKTYGDDAKLWFQRWRIFFMSCEKLFGYNNGSEWGVSHYRFSKR